MNAGTRSRAVLLCLLVAAAGAIAILGRHRAGAARDTPGDPGPGGQAGEGAAPVRYAAAPRTPSFEERLRGTQNVDWKNNDARAQRGAILVEWLSRNRGAALRYIARNRFGDLWMPGVTKAIGETATASEILDIANGAENPGDAVYQVARWAGPSVINGLANLMASVNAEAAGPTAYALGNLLSGINLDRAVAFAMSQATDPVRAYAIAGVLEQLSASPNGDAEVRAIFATLPPALQGADQVAAAYGDAIWESDPAAALQALEAISSPTTRMFSLMALANRSASTSPETAIAALYASGLPEQGVVNHVIPILQKWSAVDPQAAANFLATTQIIPGGDLPKYAPAVTAPSGPK
jgi:hypothetical protein